MTPATTCAATSSRNCTIGNHLLAEALPRGRFYHAPTSPVTTYSPCPRRHLEQFQFETLRISNHTACRFAEKTRFFRLASGRAALCRRLAFSPFSKVKRSRHHLRPLSSWAFSGKPCGLSGRGPCGLPPHHSFFRFILARRSSMATGSMEMMMMA